MIFYRIVAFFVLICIYSECQVSAQEQKFIIALTEYTTSLSDSKNRCYATVITDRHVLTTAECARTSSASNKLGISIEFSSPGTSGQAQGI